MAVDKNTTYRGKKILLGLMSNLNLSTMEASKALDISAFVTNFNASTKQQTESVSLMANDGQQSADNIGSSKFEGTLDLNLATGLLSTLVGGVIGSSTQSALTADAWAADVVTAVGDIVKLSTGEYLVAQSVKGDKETGADEPDITGKSDYDNLALDGADADNGVIWKLRDNLYNSPDHKTGFCTDKFFIIERVSEGCGETNVFDTVSLNVELTSFNIEKADGNIAQKQSISWLATSTKRSSDTDYLDITITTEVKPRELTYNAEHIKIRVDGAEYGTAHNFKLNYSRKVTATDSIEPNTQITKVDAPELTGDITIELDPAEYAIVQKSTEKVITIEFDRGDGEKALATYSKAVFNAPEVVVNGNEPRLLTIQIKPIGNSSSAMGTFNITTATAK